MGALLDVVVSFLIFMAAFNFGPLLDMPTRAIDYNTAQRTQIMFQKAIDEARTTAVATGTPGLLDNDGVTIVINGKTLTIYPERPISSTPLGPPETIYLPTPINAAGTTTALQTTLFVAPNGNVLMQDDWQYGNGMTPSAGCPHPTMTLGTSYTLSIDCTTGETQLSG